MKSISRFLILIVICFPLYIQAQDWQCVREGMTANFADTSAITTQYPTKTLWSVNIDSVRVHQGWMYHYGFKMLRFFSKTLNIVIPAYDYCYDPRGPSRMGFAISAREGENFFFNSVGDGIRISTLSNLDQPWICCRINDSTLLHSTVTSMDVEPVLGVIDSVKYISFQAKRITGELVSHPLNNMVFVLSKHFGMITLFDFYQFPNYSSNNPVHWLTGIKAPGNQSGDQNLTAEEIYSYGPGDIFHTDLGGTGSTYSGGETKSVIRILDTLWNSTRDTVTFRMSRYNHYSNWSYHHYYKDTVIISYAIHSGRFNNFPEQTIFSHDTNGMLNSVTSYQQLRGSGYNSRWIKSYNSSNIFQPCSYSADTLLGKRSQPGGGYWEN